MSGLSTASTSSATDAAGGSPLIVPSSGVSAGGDSGAANTTGTGSGSGGLGAATPSASGTGTAAGNSTGFAGRQFVGAGIGAGVVGAVGAIVAVVI